MSPVRKKRKNRRKPRKYKITLTRNQYELLKQYSAYTQQKPRWHLKQAVNMYIRQISRELDAWKHITPQVNHVSENDQKYHQLELFVRY